MPKKLQSIGKNTFSGCTNLHEIEFPKSLVTIGEGAFYNCTNLKEIELRKVVIEDGVKKLEYRSFGDCELLSEIIIPESVCYIGGRAFEGCKNLKTVTVSKDCEIDASAFVDTDVKINYYD